LAIAAVAAAKGAEWISLGGSLPEGPSWPCQSFREARKGIEIALPYLVNALRDSPREIIRSTFYFVTDTDSALKVGVFLLLLRVKKF